MVDKNLKPRIHVVAGIILNSRDEVLIAKRPSHLDQGGLWEFPGGKRECGESNAQALVRELYEELDVMADIALPMMQITHEYSEKIVTLNFFEIPKWHRKPVGKEGQLISWVAKNQLEEYAFPAANKIVLRALKLPRIVLVTPIVGDKAKFIDGIERCLATGRITVQLTRPDLSIAKFRSLSQSVYDLCEKYHAQLILDSTLELMGETLSELPKAGLHLNKDRLRDCTERPVRKGRLLTAACHTLDELKQAELLDVDAVLLTSMKGEKIADGCTASGWHEAVEICNHATVPVFADGSLQPDEFPQAIASGCYGMVLGGSRWALAEAVDLGKLPEQAQIPLPPVDCDD